MQKHENAARGKVFYGMHFYPGVAQYDEPGVQPLMVYLNEQTIREMGPTFEARPVFVQHTNEVNDDLDQLRSEADGWVVESFFNQADGKHWVKFVVTSDQGLEAVKKGFRLSNAYFAKKYGQSGIWNGVSYDKEVTEGEYEHLALVPNPRYDESVVMTPEQFKTYNANASAELKKFANSLDNEKGESTMFFKKEVLKNAKELEETMVTLKEAKKDVTLKEAIALADKYENMHGYANGDHLVKVGEKDEMSVNDLVKKHMAACNEIEDMKKAALPKDDKAENDDAGVSEDVSDPTMENDVADDQKTVGDRGGDKSLENEDDEDKDKDKEKDKDKKSNELTVEEAEASLARAKAKRLANAHTRGNHAEPDVVIGLPQDQVARGKARYGSAR